MTSLNLSPSQWNYLSHGLRNPPFKLPSSGAFQPFYNATSWDYDDLYHAAREDAVRSRSQVMQLIADYKTHGAWPRGRYAAKFWLKARWGEAAAYAQAAAEAARDLANPPTPPKDVRAAVAWLLYDAWDTTQVDFWLRENLENYTTFETYGMFPEDYAEYSKWLDLLRAGRYLPKRIV